jgi:hypothetical protein
MQASTTKLNNFLTSRFSYLELVKEFEKDNYVELLYRIKDNQNHWISTVIPYLLNGLSICKRYILKQDKVAFLWSISIFGNYYPIDETVNEAIEKLEKIDITNVKAESSINRDLHNGKVIARIDISKLQNYMKPKENQYGRLDTGAFLISNSPEAMKEISRTVME